MDTTSPTSRDRTARLDWLGLAGFAPPMCRSLSSSLITNESRRILQAVVETREKDVTARKGSGLVRTHRGEKKIVRSTLYSREARYETAFDSCV